MTLQVPSSSIYGTEDILNAISPLHFHALKRLKIVIKKKLKKTEKNL